MWFTVPQVLHSGGTAGLSKSPGQADTENSDVRSDCDAVLWIERISSVLPLAVYIGSAYETLAPRSIWISLVPLVANAPDVAIGVQPVGMIPVPLTTTVPAAGAPDPTVFDAVTV